MVMCCAVRCCAMGCSGSWDWVRTDNTELVPDRRIDAASVASRLGTDDIIS